MVRLTNDIARLTKERDAYKALISKFKIRATKKIADYQKISRILLNCVSVFGKFFSLLKKDYANSLLSLK